MRILYITNELNTLTGWGVLSYYTILNMSKNHNCDVLTLKKAINIEIENVNYFPLLTTTSDTKLKMLIMIKDLISIKINLNLSEYDIIHFLVEPFIPLSLYFKHKNIFFNIVGTYSDVSFSSGFNKFFYNLTLSRLNKIIAISDYTKKRFIEATNYKEDIYVLPLGVDTNKYSPIEGIKKENSISFVGHIKERKGLIILLEVFRRIISNKKTKDTKLYLIGSNEDDMHANQDYLKLCRDFIEKNGLSENITFTGQVSESELISYYQRSKVNVLASQNIGKHFEGFGLVHLEANAVGTLTIGTLNTGNESAIINDSTGFLVDQKDEEQLYIVLDKILNFSDFEYKEYSDSCIKHAILNDWKEYSNKLKNIYIDNLK